MQQTSLTLALSTPNPQEPKTQRDEMQETLCQLHIHLPPTKELATGGKKGGTRVGRATGVPSLFLRPPPPSPLRSSLAAIFLCLSQREQAVTCCTGLPGAGKVF